MPHANDVVPQSLSSDSVRVGKAGASLPPIDMSDLSDSGTAAAAAALGRLLASGDHKMQSETLSISRPDAGPAKEPVSLRDVLLGTTTIPGLGKTFAEALIDVRSMTERHNASAEDNAPNEVLDALHSEWGPVETAILSATPVTLRDVIAILDRVVPELPEPMRTDQQDVECLPRVLHALRSIYYLAHGTAATLDRSSKQQDRPILDAFGVWLKKLEGFRQTLTDSEAEALADQADVLALECLKPEPTTLFGYAVQHYVTLHLQHGGTNEDPLQVDREKAASSETADGKAERLMLDRAARLAGRPYPDAFDLPVSTPTPSGPDTELVEAFLKWRDACDLDCGDDTDTPEYQQNVQDERLWCKKTVSLPATSLVGVLVKLAAFLDYGWDNYENDKNHPAKDALRTLKEACNALPEPHARIAKVATEYGERFAKLYHEESAARMVAANERDAARTELSALKRKGKGVTPSLQMTMLCQMVEDIRKEFTGSIETKEGVTAEYRLDHLEGVILSTVPQNIADVALQIEVASGLLDMINADMDDAVKGHTEIDHLAKINERAKHLVHWIGNASVCVSNAAKFDPTAFFPHYIGVSVPVTPRGIKSEPGDDRADDSTDGDQALWAAWGAYVQKARNFYDLPLGTPDEDRIANELTQYEIAVEEAPISSVQGVNLKLRYVLFKMIESDKISEFLIFGGDPNKEFLDELKRDFKDRTMWQLVQATGGTKAIPANSSDAFAATVSAFETEAPTTLAVPQQPTGGMVEAGATAAGITPEQFQAAYAAAVEALKKERAA